MWVWGERKDLNGGDTEEMTSLEISLGKGSKGLKGEVVEVLTGWMVYRITSWLQVFLDKTIGAIDNKLCEMCNRSS